MRNAIAVAFGMMVLAYALMLTLDAHRILERAMSLNKRAQVLEQEIGKLDRRIKKQEGLPHGYGRS